MILLIRNSAEKQEKEKLIKLLEDKHFTIHQSEGLHTTVLGLVGDTSSLDIDALKSLDIVEDVKRIQEPYKAANRKFHPKNTVVHVGSLAIGDGHFQVIAGPCSVESEDQIQNIAQSVQASGATLLRGGAFKPRTSPYAFQGLKAEGLELLKKAKDTTGMPIVTEIMSPAHLELFSDVDIIQVGARNMQNFDLLKELGRQPKPILLKRGLANAIPMLKKLSHLPVVVDPSHATGNAALVEPMSMAAVAAGADGLIIEVHNNPAAALCDGAQSLRPESFDVLMKKILGLRTYLASGI